MTASPLSVFNVADFGATGDGEADDTAACQTALNAAGCVEGGLVVFPRGVYMVNPLFVPAGVSVLGAGSEITIVKRRPQAVTNTTSEGALNFHGTSSAMLSGFFVRDLTCDGSNADITNAGGAHMVDNEAFSFIYCKDFTVDSCRGIDAVGDGFDFDYCANGAIVNSVAIGNGGNGFHASMHSSRLKFLGNCARNNGYAFNRSGFDQWGSVENCVFVGNVAEANYQNYKMQGSGAVVVGNQSLEPTTIRDEYPGVATSGVVEGVKVRGDSSRRGDIFTASGWTYLVGKGAAVLQHTLALPVTFSEIHSIQVSRIGNRDVSAGIPLSPLELVGSNAVESIQASAINGASLDVRIARASGTYGAAYQYGYSWQVKGRL